METATTKGIKITVKTFFLDSQSRPLQGYFAHAYHITIENQSSENVQLLRRHWYIYDGMGIIKEVEGEGIVGEKPSLSPGQSHQYTSWCPLTTSIGKMHGTFTMQTTKDRKIFKVIVPEFQLIAPAKLN